MEARDRIRFLCDENVRRDIVEYLSSRGHEVLLSRDVLATSAPDDLLALLGRDEGLVVITHDKHFKKFRDMVPHGHRRSFKPGYGRLWLNIPSVDSPQRVSDEIENIEHHYAQAQRRNMLFDMIIRREVISIRSKANELGSS